MRTVKYSKRFLRDYSKLKLSGRRKMEKLNKILDVLIDGEDLDPIHLDHPLRGKWRVIGIATLRGIGFWFIELNPL